MNTVAKSTTERSTHPRNLPQLSFNDVSFSCVDHKGATWLRGTEIAKALGMDRRDAIGQIYQRNSDEFTDSMTLTLKLRVNGFGGGNSARDVRVFSLRGAHLLAMFARTTVAKEFRKWVLDVLERQTEHQAQPKPRQSSVDERTPLRQYVEKMIANKKGMIYPDIWKLVHDRFDVTHINQLTGAESLEAVEYLKAMEGEFLGKENKSSGLDLQMHVHNINAACIHMNFIHRVWKEDLYPALRNLESPLASKLYDRIVDACFIVHSVRRGLEMASGLQGIQYKH